MHRLDDDTRYCLDCGSAWMALSLVCEERDKLSQMAECLDVDIDDLRAAMERYNAVFED